MHQDDFNCSQNGQPWWWWPPCDLSKHCSRVADPDVTSPHPADPSSMLVTPYHPCRKTISILIHRLQMVPTMRLPGLLPPGVDRWLLQTFSSTFKRIGEAKLLGFILVSVLIRCQTWTTAVIRQGASWFSQFYPLSPSCSFSIPNSSSPEFALHRCFKPARNQDLQQLSPLSIDSPSISATENHNASRRKAVCGRAGRLGTNAYRHNPDSRAWLPRV